MNITKGQIANALTSVAEDHVVATTNDLYDTRLQDYQHNINEDLYVEIEELEGKFEEATDAEIDSIIDSLTI